MWKDGRLQHFQGAGKENSRTFAVSADAEPTGLHVKAGGRESSCRLGLGPPAFGNSRTHGFAIRRSTLMGCDDGQASTGQLTSIGMERITAAGQEQTCAHYRLTRNVPYELWYDAQDRLVREEWTSNGHHTVLALVHLGH